MGYRDYSTAKGHIVDATGHGDFSTIQAAINAAVSGQTIFVRPGTYTENITLKDGVDLVSFNEEELTPSVIIKGKVSFSSGGISTLSGLRIETNGDYAIQITGVAATTIFMWSCYLNLTDFDGFNITNASGAISFEQSFTNFVGGSLRHFVLTGGTLTFVYSQTGGGGITPPLPATTNNASVVYFFCTNGVPVESTGTGGASYFYTFNTTGDQTCYVSNALGSHDILHSHFTSGNQVALSIGAGSSINCYHTTFGTNNATAIDGAGAITYADLIFPNGKAITTATQNPVSWKPYATAGTSVTAVRGTAGFDSTHFTVTDGFVQAIGGPGSYISLSPFIVGTDGFSGYATIAAAITAAVAAGATDATPMNVYIKPKANGTAYTENLTLQPGVNLIGFARTPTIVGKLTYTQAGTTRIEGLRLQTNGDFFLEVSGAAASVVEVNNCYLNCSNASGISFSSSSSSSLITVSDCLGNLGTTGIAPYASTSAGTLLFIETDFTNTGGTTTAANASAGAVGFRYSTFLSPFSTTGTANFTAIYFQVVTTAQNATSITIGGSGTGALEHCALGSGTAVALSISTDLLVSHTFINSSNANAISGAGTMSYAFISFAQSSGVSLAGTTPLATLI